MKTCKKCGETRSVEEFYRDERAKDGRRSTCTPCTRRQQAEYALANRGRPVPATKSCPRCGLVKSSDDFHRNKRRPDGLLAYCKVCWAHMNRAQKYGITVEEYEELLARSDGVCAICTAPVGLCVDHDHQSGAIRGILCGNCNRGIGYLQDDPERLRAAASYLEQLAGRVE